MPAARTWLSIQRASATSSYITTMVFDHGARKRSYELLAREFGLAL